jgi:DNA-binding NtrC family response regulator
MTVESKRILLVDDDPTIADILRNTFDRGGCRIETVASIGEMKSKLSAFSYDAILLDLVLGDDEGLEALPFIFQRAPYSKIFILTAYGTIDIAVDAMKRGVAGFLTKDSGPQRIFEEVSRILDGPVDVGTPSQVDLGIIGQCNAIAELRKTLLRLKDIDSTVLVLGESGTGKELIARGLHMASHRRSERFEAINCGAIPENLLESELFGHKKGAFTDAKADRKGIFEICSQGTLFLDEIGEMPVQLQTKLLRVLQEKEVTPLGSNTSIKVQTRVVAATNKNLLEEVKQGRFRDDLYFRLSVLPLRVPALRERRTDIPLLVRFFLDRFNKRFSRNIEEPVDGVMASLVNYDWPGNVRELQNAIERGVILSQDEKLHVEDMFLNVFNEEGIGAVSSDLDPGANDDEAANQLQGLAGDIFSLPLSEAKQMFEKAYLQHVLAASNGNITEAAQLSGRYRADIYRLMNKYRVSHH